MEVFVSAALPIVLEKAAALVEGGLGLMFGVEEEREKLESILSTIQAVLQDAEEKQLKDRQIRMWLAKLKNAALEAEDILDELHYEVTLRTLEKPDRPRKIRKVRDFLTSLNPFSKDNMVVKMKQVVARFESIAGERSKFQLTADSSGVAAGSQSGTRDPRETDSKIIESTVVGRDEDIRKIREFLISEAAGGRRGVSILSIVGVGGLGKTTLAQMAYSDRQVAEVFEPKVWVYVSDVFNVPNLLKKIIESATKKNCASENNMEVLRSKVTQILEGKKFLLVLDDIWTQDKEEWHRLEVSLRDGAQGSCVIVTTRGDRVSSIVDPLYVHRPEPLSEDDCWKLFVDRAFSKHSENKDPSLAEMGRAIVRKCGGLPLAARTLGCLLHGQSEAVWTSVMQSEIWELKDDTKILPSLRLSYQHLPQHVKPCFAYCAVTPKGYTLDRETLVQLWMANGFISPDSNMEMEQKGHEIFKELISRSLFQDIGIVGDGNMRCRMHDLVHDLAKSILGNECYILDKPGNLSDKELRHLSVTINAPLPTITEVVETSQILRTLFFVTDISMIKSAFVPETARLGANLRVLDLDNTTTRTFPISVCRMKHLRYLDFSHTYIEAIPEAIRHLLNLQTLRLIGCRKLRKLPRGMGKMRSLRHLYLDGCSELNRMPRGMGELRYLRTLTRYVVGEEDGSGSIAELNGMDLCGKLQLYGLRNVSNAKEAEDANLCYKQNLQFLALSWTDSSPSHELIAQEVLEALHPPHSLKRLRIESFPGYRFPTWLMEDPVLPSLSVGQGKNLNSLQELSLVSCDGLAYLPVEVILGLSSLKVLKIVKCHNLVGSTSSGAAIGGLQLHHLTALEELQVGPCEKLTSFPHNSLQQLTALKKLWLSSCPTMTGLPKLPESLVEISIVECSNITTLPEGLGNLPALVDLLIADLPSLTSLPEGLVNLSAPRKLVIAVLPNLTYLPEELGNLPSLKQLGIGRSLNLTYLPERLGNLSGLTGLSIEDLPNLTSLPEGLGNLSALMQLEIRSLPNVTYLPRGLGNLSTLVGLLIKDLPNLTSLPEGLGNLSGLARLSIEDLPNLTSLPEGMERLEALVSLKIRRCPSLISLPRGLQQHLRSLKTLSIGGCPELQRRFQLGGDYCDLISSIPITEIGEERRSRS